MIKIFNYPKQRAQYEAYIAENPVNHIWHDGAVMRVYTGDDIPAPEKPAAITPRQIRLALNQLGLRSTVDNAVKLADQDLKDWWEYSLEIDRNHPQVLAMCYQLGITDEQADDLFSLAATL